MPAILFALIPFFGWAVGDVFATIASRKIGSFSTTFWVLMIRLVFSSLYIPFVVSDIRNLTLGLFSLNIIIAVVWVIGIIALYEAFTITNPALVGAIANSFGVITVILSMIFLKETINSNQLIAILVIFLGLILSVLDFQGLRKGKFITSTGIILAIITMFSWGIYFAFIKIPVQHLGWFWPNYISLMVFPLVILFAKIRKAKINKPTFKGGLLPLSFLILLSAIGDFSYNFAIGKGLVSLVIPIAGSAPVLFVVLAFIFFKDKITRQQILGIFTTLVGIVLLSLFSV